MSRIRSLANANVFAFVLTVSCLICLSQASDPSLSVMSWLPKHRQFCNVSLSSGALSNCFGLPNVYVMGLSGVSYKDHIYIAAQNLSATGNPWNVLAINTASHGQIEWATSFTQSNFAPYMTTYSTSMPDVLVMAGATGYTWAVNNKTADEWYSFGYGLQGTFDQSLQEYWSVTSSYIYRQNVLAVTVTEITNQYNIVLVAVSPTRQVLYCMAQAADASLLYAYDTYLKQWSFIGCMTNMILTPYSAAILDPSETYMSFFATVNGKLSLITIDVNDASVTYSVASPDPGILLLQAF